MKNDTTFKELKKSGYTDKTINQEIQANLIAKIKAKEPVFEGLWGYEDTVIPQLKKAILAGHHINLLGLRGQAKTRIARSMVNLLDEYMPIVKGSEINDSPFNPISKFARDLNLSSKEGKWFGASNYAGEFSGIPYKAFLPILRDDNFKFISEEELPDGYKPGEMMF